MSQKQPQRSPPPTPSSVQLKESKSMTSDGGDDDSALDISEQTNRPNDSSVQQQHINAWHPILDPEWMIYSYLILAVVMIPLGTLMFVCFICLFVCLFGVSRPSLRSHP
jgi:hypothetical protein